MDGTITRYVYHRNHILLEFDGNNEFQARYVYGNNIDHPIKMERKESPYKDNSYQRQDFFYHRDRLGNVTEITNFVGEVVQRYVYDAFGNFTIYDDEGNEITAASAKYLKNPFTFASREFEPDSGHYDNRARRYDSETGLYLSADPIGLGGGDVNVYRYVRNNPLNFTDPYGLDVYFISYEGTVAASGKAKSASIGIAFDSEANFFDAFRVFSTRGKGTSKGLYLGASPQAGYVQGGLDDFFGTSTELGFNYGLGPVIPLKTFYGGQLIQAGDKFGFALSPGWRRNRSWCGH